ncbi:PD-(D/E)XK nuclease family protein [Streptantibioticus ferralitis]|uniref:PD-(D/E)XK nuclease family protein n=1 Tax=Streptantibioticus ferralitis TaxID=236510 RepID=A0ABT5Z1J3_9ACTN|nr:PD-(D/E)XK nuclease family protein [Streptantibioticus ferralitis]MDF2257708.1 PD-(D/E)XK nuclease family protein [Streptantibioticus ferralitis]
MSTEKDPKQLSAAYWSALADEVDALRADGRWLPGPATTLEVIGRSGVEVDHERLIAWLLDPLAAHGLGPALLGAMLYRSGVSDAPPPEELVRARVKKQVVRATSRPDIVVLMPSHTLVIELKINSEEGAGQTTRQADDHANVPNAVLVFLTLHHQQPTDGRFRAMGLRSFAEDLRQALSEVLKPASYAAARGRATADNYLATLERMLGMDPADQEAARFWLSHRKSLPEAQQAAQRLLTHLPEYVAKILESLAGELGDDLVVSSFHYMAPSQRKIGDEFEEQAVLLSRKRWLTNGKARLGIGLGQRVDVNPDRPYQRPWWGVYAADLDAVGRLRDTWKLNNKPWAGWVWWKYLDLEPPADRSDLLTHYARDVAQLVRVSWKQDVGVLNQVLDPPAS